MDENEFLKSFEENILKGEKLDMDTDLTELARWDSVAVVSFIAWVDLDYGLRLNPLEVDTAATVRELYELVQEARE